MLVMNKIGGIYGYICMVISCSIRFWEWKQKTSVLKCYLFTAGLSAGHCNRSPLCCHHSSDQSRYGLHKTSEGMLWYLAIWLCSRSFMSCNLEGGASIYQSYFQAHFTDAQLVRDLGELENLVIFVMSLKQCRKRPLPVGETIAIMRCIWSAAMFR